MEYSKGSREIVLISNSYKNYALLFSLHHEYDTIPEYIFDQTDALLDKPPTLCHIHAF